MFEDKDYKIAILIPAAGNSSRLGTMKQLVQLHGRTLINHVIHQSVISNIEKIYVILGSGASEIQVHIPNQNNVSVIENETWQKGLLNSIQFGCRQILIGNKYSHVLILHGDQYQISSKHIKALVMKSRNYSSSIIASSYSNTIGVPCVFPISFIKKIINLPKGESVKKLLLNEFKEGHVALYDLPQASVDLDTPEDLHVLRTKNEK